MEVVCLDLEGVLTPEIWIAVAERTGIEALRATTRDVADYDELMAMRLAELARHDLRLADLEAVIATLEPLAGAREFLDELRARHQVCVLSDTFYEFAGPLMAKLGRPTLFCHHLEVDGGGRITGYRLRLPDQKRAVVGALRALNFTVLAAGDSFNDISMLEAADRGFLFRPSPAVRERHPQFPVFEDHPSLRAALAAATAT